MFDNLIQGVRCKKNRPLDNVLISELFCCLLSASLSAPKTVVFPKLRSDPELYVLDIWPAFPPVIVVCHLSAGIRNCVASPMICWADGSSCCSQTHENPWTHSYGTTALSKLHSQALTQGESYSFEHWCPNYLEQIQIATVTRGACTYGRIHMWIKRIQLWTREPRSPTRGRFSASRSPSGRVSADEVTSGDVVSCFLHFSASLV